MASTCSLIPNRIRRLLSAARYDTKTLGSLLSQRVLGNFKVASEDKNSSLLTQNAINRQLPIPFQYGGDIAGNIVLAARLPVSSQSIMSLSIQYVSPGDYSEVRNYLVEKVHLSGRFGFLMVTVKQEHRIVAIGNVAYHGTEASAQSLLYDPPFPGDCSMPADLLDDNIVLQELQNNYKSSDLNYARRAVDMVREFGQVARPCHPLDYFRLNKEPLTRLSFWMRFPEKEMDKVFPDIQPSTWSPALLAYASDFRILAPALRQNPAFRDGKMASLSHSIWFSPHADCQLESPTQWVLYDTRLMMSGNNIILCQGHMWNEKKKLLAITMQQGLCRPKIKATKRS